MRYREIIAACSARPTMSVRFAPNRSASIPQPMRPATDASPETPSTLAAAIRSTPWSIACVARGCAAHRDRAHVARRIPDEERGGDDDQPAEIADRDHGDAPVERRR